MEFCCLGSGSKGNATLIRHEQTLLMVDCGFATKHTEARMQRVQCHPRELTAILVTHEHSDHIAGVSKLARKYQIPVYMTRGTARSGKVDLDVVDVRWIDLDQPFRLDEVDVLPVSVPHDAREPCQFIFSVRERCLGIVTDLGSVSEHVARAYSQCHALLLESNHDEDMLWAGPYPQSVKQRVISDWGHLSNRQAHDFLQLMDIGNLSTLVLGHISEQNNDLHLVKGMFDRYQAQIQNMLYACQEQGFPWQKV